MLTFLHALRRLFERIDISNRQMRGGISLSCSRSFLQGEQIPFGQFLIVRS